MSLLEDAIREHLELKRKHGASDDELLREEADALGPARREPEPAETAEPPEHEQGEMVAERELQREEPPGPPAGAALEDDRSAELESELDSEDGSEPDVEEASVRETPEDPEPLQEESVAEELPAPLEEAPEPDRLPFEQKPPRDFDFD